MAPSSQHLEDKQRLHLPRILCLHGGGSNARIFRLQCRVIGAELKNHFRMVFVEAPFSSEPGPDVTKAYEKYGPYNRWIRSKASQPQVSAEYASKQIEAAWQQAFKEDSDLGATGPLVGVLGFSQGAKIAASMLLRQQTGSPRFGKSPAPTNFQFGILMAGRGPLVSLDCIERQFPTLLDASELFNHENLLDYSNHNLSKTGMLEVPTIHVHGVKDPDIALHRALLNSMSTKSAMVVEWDGGHRVPIQTKDVDPLIDAIFRIAQRGNTIRNRPSRR